MTFGRTCPSNNANRIPIIDVKIIPLRLPRYTIIGLFDFVAIDIATKLVLSANSAANMIRAVENIIEMKIATSTN